MYFSTWWKRIVHIYFNYHFVEQSSQWLNSNLTRHLQFAFRMLIAFVLACLIIYGTKLRNHLSLQFLIPNMTILLIQETFGLTLRTTIQLIMVIIPLSILLFLLQKVRLIYYHYLLNELLYLSLSFLISYKSTHVPTRKLSLLFLSIFFATMVNQTQAPLFFAFDLLSDFVIAMGISITVSLLIFPLFATFDIENRTNYCLSYLQQMYNLIIEAFLCDDEISANVYLSRATIMEKMIRESVITTRSRFVEIDCEPARLLQRLVNRKRRHLINLTVQEQEDLTSLLMLDICSLKLVVQQQKFNPYHKEYSRVLKGSLLTLSSSQSLFISCLITSSSITRHQLHTYLTNLQLSFDSLRSSYIQIRLYQIKNTFQSNTSIESEDNLSHAFFLFQLGSIVRLLSRSTLMNNTVEEKKEKKCWKEYFKGDWPRFLSAMKTTIIITVASLFVMIPNLAKNFESGLWILIALCMSQGDTVGGAFTAMKMRLIGTLLGAMWAYVTYLSAGNSVYKTVLMLCPWIFFCGYMKLYPQWGYTVTVAASTPIVVNLGRLPFAETLPAGNYALLRIQQNVIGIAIAVGLTILITPVFAIDLLKENIHLTLQSCQHTIKFIVYVYDKLFEHENSGENLIDLSKIDEIQNSLHRERRSFNRMISIQRTLVTSASVEPSFWWVNNGFSSSRYKLLVQQQIDLYRMLHNIHSSLFRINQYSNIDQLHIENLRHHAADGLFLPDLHNEFHNVNKQLDNCFQIWSEYFSLTQTKSSQFYRGSIHHRKHLKKEDLKSFEQCLIDLHHVINTLQIKHQEATNHVLKHYFQRFSSGEMPEHFIPYVQNDQADSIFIALSAMYYSITQLVKAALALGTTIHEVFELEITDLYRRF